MRHFLIALVLAAGLAAPSLAADTIVHRDAAVATPAPRQLPFPRTERAAAVWNERACWSRCGASCAWGMAACLTRDPQGVCLDATNACDRACLRSCRTSGGPYLPDIFDY